MILTVQIRPKLEFAKLIHSSKRQALELQNQFVYEHRYSVGFNFNAYKSVEARQASSRRKQKELVKRLPNDFSERQSALLERLKMQFNPQFVAALADHLKENTVWQLDTQYALEALTEKFEAATKKVMEAQEVLRLAKEDQLFYANAIKEQKLQDLDNLLASLDPELPIERIKSTLKRTEPFGFCPDVNP